MEEFKILSTLDVLQYKDKGMPITLIQDELFCLVTVESLFEDLGLEYFMSGKVSNSYVDIFKDKDGNGAIVTYVPAELMIKTEGGRLYSIPGYKISRIDVYYETSGEMEELNLSKVIELHPTEDFDEFLREIIEKLEERAKGIEYTF